jgi:SAM-dependent methyltransferase
MNRMTNQQIEDFSFLMENARAGRALQLPNFIHLDQPIGIWNYIRIADDILTQVPSGHLLDWGCGHGQMTYLMKQRGLHVTSFDVGDPDAHGPLPAIPLSQGLDIVRSRHPTNLPFPDGSFDAVLSCGVLEHVDEFSVPGNELLSLREIARVLQPRGRFLIYQLPQKYAWQEAIIRRLRLGYAHPRRYTEAEITRMLNDNGFELERIHRANLVPKNLTAIPNMLRTLYSRVSRPLLTLDNLMCSVPGLRLLAGVLEISARRRA